jgi:hypothetical protein
MWLRLAATHAIISAIKQAEAKTIVSIATPFDKFLIRQNSHYRENA